MHEPHSGTPGARVRALLAERRAVAVPGTHDALGAMLAERAGFPAVYLSGYCVAASHGKPDIGLVTADTMIRHAAEMAAAVRVPVIADADTGYGGAANIAETVRAYERAGVAALHLEDQVAPKKCGAMAGKELVGDDEMAARLRAALRARSSPDFLVIGRTDAMTRHGLAESIRRLRKMAETGVDAVMVPSLASLEDCRAVAEAVPVPVLHTVAETLRPLHTQHELAATGLGMALYPITMVQALTALQVKILATLRDTGSTAAFEADMMGLPAISELLGASRYAAFEADVARGS
ncbi:MAG: isocitrate lyase/phosphoenolpyruvate mutase family protein [Burkholderiales bacterium]